MECGEEIKRNNQLQPDSCETLKVSSNYEGCWSASGLQLLGEPGNYGEPLKKALIGFKVFSMAQTGCVFGKIEHAVR
jgi:hypothetical protein